MVLLQHDIGLEFPDRTQVCHCYYLLICGTFLERTLIYCNNGNVGPALTKLEKFKNALITSNFGFVFDENSSREITWFS